MHYFLHYIDVYLCVQTLVISSAKVKWAKQGTCVLVDNEPMPPTIEGYQADKGWKMVKNVKVCQEGGNFLFPEDQLLVCLANGYRVMKTNESRLLSAIAKDKQYLVWYHHLMPFKVWKKKTSS